MADSTVGENTTQNVVEEVSRIAELSKQLQDSAASLISRSSHEEASLRQRALSLDSSIKNLRSSIASSVKKGTLGSERPKNWKKSYLEQISRKLLEDVSWSN